MTLRKRISPIITKSHYLSSTSMTTWCVTCSIIAACMATYLVAILFFLIRPTAVCSPNRALTMNKYPMLGYQNKEHKMTSTIDMWHLLGDKCVSVRRSGAVLFFLGRIILHLFTISWTYHHEVCFLWLTKLDALISSLYVFISEHDHQLHIKWYTTVWVIIEFLKSWYITITQLLLVVD